MGAKIDIVRRLLYVAHNMKATLSISQAQAQLPAVCRSGRTVAVTRNGEVVSFVVPKERMAALLEQMEILASSEAMSAIHQAKAGKGQFHDLKALDEN